VTLDFHGALRRGAGLLVLGLVGLALSVCADEARAQSRDSLKTIVVTGQKLPTQDAEVQQQVETAMRTDRYFFDEHVTVTVKDGVVTLTGIVFDEWDLRAARRIARRIPGVRRVINDIELVLGGE
jgi:osmotically-inducible protein OsmY